MKEIPDEESSLDLTLQTIILLRGQHGDKPPIWRETAAHLSLDSIVDTRAIFPTVLKNSNRLTPPVQSRLLTIRTEPSAAKVPPCAVPSRLRVLD